MGWAETFSAPRFRRELIRYIADRMPEHWSPALREAVQARATAEEAQ